MKLFNLEDSKISCVIVATVQSGFNSCSEQVFPAVLTSIIEHRCEQMATE